MSNAAIVMAREEHIQSPMQFTEEQTRLIRNTYANGASEQEFEVFMEICRARRLNPLMRQIYFVSRWDSAKRANVWQPQISIDGMRAVAERTSKYAGQDEPEFIYEGKSLHCAKVRVYRKDWGGRPAVGVAFWDEYVQRTKEGEPTRMWKTMGHTMLAKCAESQALRKAFPEDLSGLYSPEEMAQATNEPKMVTITEDGEVIEGGGEPKPKPEPLSEHELWAITEAFTNAKTFPALRVIARKTRMLYDEGRMTKEQKADAEKLLRSQEAKLKEAAAKAKAEAEHSVLTDPIPENDNLPF